MTSDIERAALLDCPFCGAVPDVEEWDHKADGKQEVICCVNHTEWMSRDDWNRRALPTADAGWVSVPREPTYEMVQAGAKLVKDNLPYHTGTLAIYQAMLAASPPQAETAGATKAAQANPDDHVSGCPERGVETPAAAPGSPAQAGESPVEQMDIPAMLRGHAVPVPPAAGLPELPEFKRLRSGFATLAGENIPMYSEYCMKADYDALRQAAECLQGELAEARADRQAHERAAHEADMRTQAAVRAEKAAERTIAEQAKEITELRKDIDALLSAALATGKEKENVSISEARVEEIAIRWCPSMPTSCTHAILDALRELGIQVKP